MAQWAVIIPTDRWATERLFHNDTVTVEFAADAVAPDDEVLLVADGGVVALTQAVKADGEHLVLVYQRRAFDQPVPADRLRLGSRTGLVPIEHEAFRELAAALGADIGLAGQRNWLVSVAMPIEGRNPADAVRQFWSNVVELGPVELPAYVWPSGDELAMQAFVLGAEANQDPEEDED